MYQEWLEFSWMQMQVLFVKETQQQALYQMPSMSQLHPLAIFVFTLSQAEVNFGHLYVY